NTQYPITSNQLYRTGDLCRWRPDGNIEYLGRMDYQVKIRGIRIELGEIESHLLKREDVKEVVVIEREESSGEKYLCAYIVQEKKGPAEEGVTGSKAGELKESLARLLPDYMIPTYFVTLETMPLTATGKINRKALPAPEKKSTKKYTAPRNEIEEKIVQMFAGLLDIEKEKIGIDDNFFYLGGHSLKATRLVAKIHKQLEVKLPLAELFNTNTVRGIAAVIEKNVGEKYQAIKPAPKRENYPLTSAQKRIYIEQQKDKKSTAYNIYFAVKLQGKIDPRRIENVFREQVMRHESLRTSIGMHEGEPVQNIQDPVEFEMQTIEANESTGSEGRELKQYIRPFELEKAPLMRVVLVKGNRDTETTPGETIHHMLIDM
ncbi:MAG: hypothetical protein GY757_24705, partial [bacterium]|nr:hypothetical protein [bacterium]